MIERLDYASPASNEPTRSEAGDIFLALDVLALLFFVSQMAFLLAMMGINIRECNVPPYGGGSAYNNRALGNAEFVTEFPGLSAAVAALPREGLNVVGYPSFFTNAFTFTVISWLVTAYLFGRVLFLQRRRRVLTFGLAILMLATLPFIWSALMVAFD